MRLLSICILFLLYNLPIHAITGDSTAFPVTVPTSVRYLYENDFRQGLKSMQTQDTSLTDQEESNPAFNLHYNFLGNLGSAASSQLYRPLKEVYTSPSIRSYDLYLFHHEDIQYYRTNKRYSDLSYHNATFREQHIRILHTQNILKNWNAGFDFNRITVKDFLPNSDVFHSRFAVFTWYESPNKRYNLFANGFTNVIKNQVNGGVSEDSLFENVKLTNVALKGLPVNLTDAENRFRKKSFSLSQYFDLGKKSDTTSGAAIQTWIRLHHEIKLEIGSFSYIDKSVDSTYYSDYNYSTSTYDSLHYTDLRNRGGIVLPYLENGGSFRKNFSATAMLEHQSFSYSQRSDTSWQNISVLGNIATRPDSSRLHFNLDGQYVLSGHDETSYSVELQIHSPLYSFGELSASVHTDFHETPLINTIYDSNHILWKNTFDKEKVSSLNVSYSLPKWKLKLEASVFNLNNYVYMNRFARPQQASSAIQVTQFALTKNFVLRSFHFDNLIYFQSTTDAARLPLPDLASTNALYYQGFLFKKAMLAQLGFDMHYNSSYYADAFMPATGSFYLQKIKKTGGYPVINFFFNMKIKTARLFIKFENLGNGLISDSYTYTPQYPQPGRVIKFGVDWRFLDQ
ncbi:MAG: putative porin [Bacteroidetes bacterium]|nr:putative porin [Bacteroidota bacterium]